MPIIQSRANEGRIHRNLFFIIVAVVTALFFNMIGPFVLTVLWAVVLAIIFYKLYRWLLKMFGVKRKSMAAALTCVLVLLFVIVPFILICLALFNQVTGLYASIQNGDVDPNVILDYVDRELPKVGSTLETYGINVGDLREKLNGYVAQAGEAVAAQALAVTSNIINIFIQFTLMLYLLFFFLKDGRTIVRKSIDTVPLGNVRERTLVQRFTQVSRATLKGTVIVAITQGAIGGILFWIVGIPAPVLWGVVMTFLALLPIGGSAIVWVPASIILFIQGETANAIVVVAVGALIIGLVDNLLRPLLVGRDTGMPDYLVLISTLGGISIFGLSGFVIGPTVAALFVTVWEMMGREFGGKSSW
ncbi:AI-2E family transporter [Neolewinella antarctica]|uniref:PurR-regulated permease PerM n=1 Tax=Neolewinella antarctica TaxID=442734 RepID=A0ABX0X867_9BACT|nr:AI-2E family transporter [Neolewinella antarctica]NJC25022.1 putative PurR-regulated permease PerM [Neolewinella antarctica]